MPFATGASELFSALLAQLLDSLVRRTRFTEVGIDHRTWFGRRIVAPWAEVSILEGDNYVSVIVGEREFQLEGRKREIEKASEILRSRVRNYLGRDYRL